jgi:hypothetical protein
MVTMSLSVFVIFHLGLDFDEFCFAVLVIRLDIFRSTFLGLIDSVGIVFLRFICIGLRIIVSSPRGVLMPTRDADGMSSLVVGHIGMSIVIGARVTDITQMASLMVVGLWWWRDDWDDRHQLTSLSISILWRLSVANVLGSSSVFFIPPSLFLPVFA